jgi:hypothetical protein
MREQPGLMEGTLVNRAPPSPFTFRRHLGLLAAFAFLALSVFVLGPGCAAGDTQTQTGSASSLGGGGSGASQPTTTGTGNGGEGGSGGTGGEGGKKTGCKDSEKKCDGKCVAIDDPAYGCKKTGCTKCEGSDNAKAACSAGVCSIGSCDTGFADCNGLSSDGCEANVQMDPTQCGACGHACVTPGATAVCTAGKCEIGSCDAGKTDCNNDPADGCEADLQNDPQNCGTCTHACSVGLSCEGGQCGDFCPPGKGDCDNNPNNGCETDLHTNTNCAFCGDDCDLPHSTSACQMGSPASYACAVTLCDDGYKDCDMLPANGCEVNYKTDANNCGSCGNVCPSGPHSTATCDQGTCKLECDPGFTDCDNNPTNGCEIQTSNDLNNCGTCSHVCSVPNATPVCAGGACEVGNCNVGFADCDGQPANGCEVNKQGDPQNCGACGHACSIPNGTAGCNGGSCTIQTCNPGRADCDMSISDGCEANTLTDPNNCGTCGHVCAVANGVGVCNAGACAIGSCNPGFSDCNHQVADGCETVISNDPNNCGGCGTTCNLPNATATCSSGACAVGTCNLGFADCDHSAGNGCEVNIGADINNCGHCGGVCNLAHTSQLCSSGACVVGTCNNGFADCNGLSQDGCEVNTTTDNSNCGGCGANCSTECTGNVTATSCVASTCEITGCSSGHYNIDGTCSDGCECAYLGTSTTCSAPTGLGALIVGHSTSYMGNLPAGGDVYLSVTLTDDQATTNTYHPKIVLTTGVGEYLFDIQTDCGSGKLSCAVEGGTSAGLTTWEETYTAGDPTSKTRGGVSNFIPIPNVGTVIIHVYRKTGLPVTCHDFVLTISD